MSKSIKCDNLFVKEDVHAASLISKKLILEIPDQDKQKKIVHKVDILNVFQEKMKIIDEKMKLVEQVLVEIVKLRDEIKNDQAAKANIKPPLPNPGMSGKVSRTKMSQLLDVDLKGLKDGCVLAWSEDAKKFICQSFEE